MECLAARETIDSSGQIIKLNRPCPWKLHIHQLEEGMKISPSIKYVLYPDDRSEKWRLQAVAISPTRFESRKPLPYQSYDGALAMAIGKSIFKGLGSGRYL